MKKGRSSEGHSQGLVLERHGIDAINGCGTCDDYVARVSLP
jgi:hypothetical protein